jgi:hypothetical protein
MDSNICNERHKQLSEDIREIKDDVTGLKTDVTDLKVSNATNTEAIKGLCEKLSILTTAIWGLVLCVVGAVLSFLFYCVQLGIAK